MSICLWEIFALTLKWYGGTQQSVSAQESHFRGADSSHERLILHLRAQSSENHQEIWRGLKITYENESLGQLN